MKVSSEDGLVHVHKGQQGSGRPQQVAGGNDTSHKPATSSVVQISQMTIDAMGDTDFNQLSNEFHRQNGGGSSMQRGIGVYRKQ